MGDPPRPIGKGEFVFTADLYGLLVETYPEREAYMGFNQARLATMLRAFNIEPEQKRRGEQVLRAYPRSMFTEWFARYGFADVADTGEPELEGSDISPWDAEAPAAKPPRPPSPSKPVAPATPLHERFSNAHYFGPHDGDKKRYEKLDAAMTAYIDSGKLDEPDTAIKVISALFLIVEQDGERFWVHLDGDHLEWVPIAAPGLMADNTSTAIVVNPSRTLAITGSTT